MQELIETQVEDAPLWYVIRKVNYMYRHSLQVRNLTAYAVDNPLCGGQNMTKINLPKSILWLYKIQT